MCRKMLRGWKSFYRNKSARPDVAGRTIAARFNSSRLSGNRTRDDADTIVFRTDQKNGIRIHSVGREVERPRRWERGCHGEGVWTGAWRGDGERPFELNIEELLAGAKLVEVHGAAGVIPGGRGYIQLADKVLLVAAYAGPGQGEVPRQRGRRDGTGGLGLERAVARDPGVNLLENGLLGRDQIENEGEASRHLGIGPGYGSAAKQIGIHRVRARHSSSRQEGYAATVVLVEDHVCDIPAAVGSEAASSGDRPARAGATD